MDEWFIDQHLYHFSHVTLARLIEASGFDIVAGPDPKDRENLLFAARKRRHPARSGQRNPREVDAALALITAYVTGARAPNAPLKDLPCRPCRDRDRNTMIRAFSRRHAPAPAAEPASLHLFALFHLNLAFSSIEEAERSTVIERCYWPLLALAATHGPIGIEASGYTLEEIEARDPAWVRRFRDLVQAGQVELIGSGYAQLIGPLVPAKLVAANLKNRQRHLSPSAWRVPHRRPRQRTGLFRPGWSRTISMRAIKRC